MNLSSEKPLLIGFATTNTHKIQETQFILSQLVMEALQVVAVAPLTDVEETGETFEANARLKLQAALKQPLDKALDWLIAEDSGLIIPGLAHRFGWTPFPGIYSDRWLERAGYQCEALEGVEQPYTYTHKCQAILHLMEGLSERHASYMASIVACPLSPRFVSQTDGSDDSIFVSEGILELEVATHLSGSGGFGYDPIMKLANLTEQPSAANQTIAELDPSVKNQVSHRYQALASFVKQGGFSHRNVSNSALPPPPPSSVS